MGKLGTEQKIYRKSHLRTKLQWKIGPLSGQFGCWKAALIDEHGRPIDWVFRWEFRCKSSACKPGDPYGCSMTKARQHSGQTRHILDAWISAGRHAYVGLFETQGRPGASLHDVYTAAQAAMKSVVSGKRWILRKGRFGVAGQLTTFSVAKSKEGNWIVRRWLVLAVDEVELSSEQASELGEFIHEVWSHSIEKAGLLVIGRFEGLRQISLEEIPAISQLLTGCISPLDPRTARSGGLEREFGLGQAREESISDLAKRYSEESKALIQLFRQFEGKLSLLRPSTDGFRVQSRHKGISKSGQHRVLYSVHPVVLPERARDFAEYATETVKVPFWSATGSGAEWKRLIDQSRELAAPYLPIPDMPELDRPRVTSVKK